MFDKLVDILNEIRNIDNTLQSINVTLESSNDKLDRIGNALDCIAIELHCKNDNNDNHFNLKTKNEKRISKMKNDMQNIVDKI
jgi:hypothetical protein